MSGQPGALREPRRRAQSQDKYVLRLPDGMRAALKLAASGNGRSLNSEIVARLSFALQSSAVDAVDEPVAAALDVSARLDDLTLTVHTMRHELRLLSSSGVPPAMQPRRAVRRRTASEPTARNMRQLKHVRRFLRCCCRRVGGGRVGAANLYAAYVAWAPIVNAERLTQTMFGRVMRLTEIEREDGQRRYYLDLDLTDIASHRMSRP